MARRTLIRLLSFICLAVIGPGHQSQAQSPSNPTSSPKGLIRCEPVADKDGESICGPVPDKTLEQIGATTFNGAWTLHVTTNLATVDHTKTWLKGIAGESFAQKAAPKVFQAIKSSRARYGTIVVGFFGGSVWLYERIHDKIYGDSESEAKYRLRTLGKVK
jgi:hypothetical protein